MRLWRALAYFGAGYAAFGIPAGAPFPEQILFETKRFYIGSLTASFVNRNTAGTFFGLAFLLNLGLGIRELRNVRSASSSSGRPSPNRIRARQIRPVALPTPSLASHSAVALFLTQSRGAVGATFVAAFVAAALWRRGPMNRR